MAPLTIDRRAVLSVLGVAAFVAPPASSASAAPASAQTWLRIDAARFHTSVAWEAALQTAHRLGVDAVTVDGAGLSSGAFAGLLARFIPAARRFRLDVHAGLGDLGELTRVWRPPPGAAADHDQPPFARTPHHRLSDPVAEALQDHLKGLLTIPGLAGLQLASVSDDRNGLGGLIHDHVIAPARLRGKVVTARIVSLAPPSTWGLDGVFRTVPPSAVGYALLRQNLNWRA